MTIDHELSVYFGHAAQVLGPYRIQAPQLDSVPDDVATACRMSPYLRTKALCEDQLIALAADRMGVSLLPTDVSYKPLADHAANIRRVGNRWSVTVDPEYIQHPDRLACILAHEVAHAALDYHSISAPSRQQNEELTDALAAIAGFGLIMARSYGGQRTITVYGATVQEGVRALGYLSPETCRRLAEIQASIANRRPHERGTVARDVVDRIDCAICASHLRLPDLEATIVLTCPRCRCRQAVRLTRGPRGTRHWFTRLFGRSRDAR